MSMSLGPVDPFALLIVLHITGSLALAYLSTPRDPGCFNDEEETVRYRKYILKKTYDGSETTCYDKLCLTKRNFHDLCAMLREKCGLKGSMFMTVEEDVAMFLQVVGHGLKMRMLGGTHCRSTETISRHFSTVLSAILCRDPGLAYASTATT